MYECISCEEVISMPMCGTCLCQRMELVLKEKGISMKLIPDKIPGYQQCIFCKNTMALCAHCYSKDMLEIVNEQHPEVTQDFVANFNFQLRYWNTGVPQVWCT